MAPPIPDSEFGQQVRPVLRLRHPLVSNVHCRLYKKPSSARRYALAEARQVMKRQFDLFGTGEAREPEVKAVPRDGVQGAQDEIDMVRQLEETGRYRVLQKLVARTIADALRPGFPLRGVIVDTETTGLNARKDEIIEIGIIAFSFDAAGNIGDVTGI